MVPSIEVSSQTFARLQALAVPLVDNPETVINRLIDFFEGREGAPAPVSGGGGGDRIRLSSQVSPPHLTHTKAWRWSFVASRWKHREANWNGLLNAAVREAKARAKSAAELKQLVIIPFVDGQKTNEGYRFPSDIGILIQGQDFERPVEGRSPHRAEAWPPAFCDVRMARELREPLFAVLLGTCPSWRPDRTC